MGDELKMYSASDPGSFYSAIELCLSYGEGLILVSIKSYITIENLDLRYHAVHGIFLVGSYSNVIIQDNDMSYLGGSDFGGGLRYGDGIALWTDDDVSDVSILDNTISQCYDTGVTVQIMDKADNIAVSDITISGNTVDYSGGGMTHSMTSMTGTTSMTNILWENNTFSNNGAGWSDPSGDNPTNMLQAALLNCEGADIQINCVFRNNLIDTSAPESGEIGQGIVLSGGEWIVTRNLIKDVVNIGIRIYNHFAGEISYNIVQGCTSGRGMFATDNDSSVVIYNNVLTKTVAGNLTVVELGQDDHDVTNITFINNIIADFGGANTWNMLKVNGDGSAVTLSNNLYYDSDATTNCQWLNDTSYDNKADWETNSGESDSVWDDPDFINEPSNNYRLKSGSPGIDAGIATENAGVNLIAHWKLNDNAASTTVVDVTGNYAGTYTDGGGAINTDTGDITGYWNGGLDFDGDEYVNCGDITELDSTGAFTIAGWFKQTTIDQIEGMFAKRKDDDEQIYIATWNDGNLYTQIESPSPNDAYGYFDYSDAVTAGVWFYYACVFDGSGSANADRLKVYIDGVSQTLSWSNTIGATTADMSGNDFYIGRADTRYWTGHIDSVAVFSTAKTQAEIDLMIQPVDYTGEDVADPPEMGAYEWEISGFVFRALWGSKSGGKQIKSGGKN